MNVILKTTTCAYIAVRALATTCNERDIVIKYTIKDVMSFNTQVTTYEMILDISYCVFESTFSNMF